MDQLEPVKTIDPILESVYNGTLTPEDALLEIDTTPTLAKGKLKRAHFIKLDMTLPNESKRLNIFLKTLFSIPIPMFFMKFALKFASKKGASAVNEHVDDDEAKSKALDSVNDLEQYYDIIKYAKHSKIDVITDDAIIHIKIL